MTETQIKWLRIFFYSLWCLAAVSAAAVLLNIAIGTDAAESCTIKVWKYGDIFNYPTGLPCTAEFYMALYVFYIILYIFFDYIRCKILNKNPSMLWRLAEIGACFLAYWLCLAYKVSDFTVLLASFISSLQLFCPLFALAILVSFVKKGSAWRLNNSSSDPNNQSINNHTSDNLSGGVLSARQTKPSDMKISPEQNKVNALKEVD